MNVEQTLFYSEMRKIQDFAIGKTLCKKDKYEDMEEMLEDITYDVIYMMCEMIDGYRNNLIKYSMINIKNGNVVNDEIALHDWCEGYLRCTSIQHDSC